MILKDVEIPIERHLATVGSYFACSHTGCQQYYDMGRGYYVDSKADNPTNSKCCLECGFQLYLANRGATTFDTFWACASKACPASIVPRP